MTLHKTNQRKDFTLNYKAVYVPHRDKQNKGLHIKVQEVCKAVYEPHKDKQNEGVHIKVQEVCNAVYEPYRDKQQNKEKKGLYLEGVSKAYENRKKQTDIIQTWTTIEYRCIEGLCLPCSMTVLSIWVEF